MKSLDINSDEIQAFIDCYEDEIPLSSKVSKEQFAEFCLTTEQNEPQPLSTLITSYFGKNDIFEFDIVSFFANFVDKNFPEKDWYWHLKRFLLLADNAHLPLDQKTHLKNKFSKTEYPSLCAALEQSVLTEAPVDFLLEGIDIKEPPQLDDKIVDYLQPFTQNASCNNWLSKHVTILSSRYQERYPNTLTDKVCALLITAIVWAINQAVAFAKEHNNPKILQSDLPFDLKEILKASELKSLDVKTKIQILLALNEPLKFCSAYPADIMKSFTSWEVMNQLVEKHPVFLKHLSSTEVPANLLKLSESDLNQTRCFVKKHLAAFIESYGFDLSHYHTTYLSGGRTPTETFTFLETVLNQQDDYIPVILDLPNNRDFGDVFKAHALLLIKTAAAYRAVWSLYTEHRDSEQAPLGYYDVLAILIDRDEKFDFNSFCQLALNNEKIARQFMQVKSKRLQKFLEYKPEMVRELFKKHPQIIGCISGNVLKAAFAQQDNLISLIPADFGYALQALLAINTPLSMKKAREQIRSLFVEKKLSISGLFREFDHAFIIRFLKESFSKDQLNSIFTAEHLYRVNHEFQRKTILSASKLSVEMADFLLEYIAEKTDFSPENDPNYKPLQHFFADCLFLLHQSKRITPEEIFSKYAHQIFGENFRPYEIWERELTILLLEKIKLESANIQTARKNNTLLENEEDKKEINDTTLKNLIALLPKSITESLHIQNYHDKVWRIRLEDIDEEISRLQGNFKYQAISENTEKALTIQKSNALFDADYAVLREGIHARYQQAMLEKTDDLSIVGDILADAKTAILTKLQSALSKIDLPEESVQLLFTHCADENFFPSRLALEDALKPLSFEKSVLEKLLDQCSDEILPALLQDSLKQLIFAQEKTDEQTPLIAFLNSTYKDYPQGWARVLLKVLEGYKTYPHHEWIKGMAFSLGILREPLGDKIPKMLDKIIKDADFVDLSEIIHRQKMLFNRENFKRGHFRKPQRRVNEALQHLIKAHEKTIALKA